MRNLKTFQDYLEALAELVLSSNGAADLSIGGATCDSRQVQPGWLFVAIPGAKEDGAAYVSAAVSAGAVGVVSPKALDLPAGVACVQVSDAYAAAARVAEVMADFPARQMRLLGVTGTNGKTTSAFLLHRILVEHGRRVGMVGTVHYDVAGKILPADRTTPPPFLLQTLLGEMRDNGVQDVVLEASSHAICQRRTGQARFAGAIFTNLTGDHLDYHETMEKYFAVKRCLFTDMMAVGARAVINTDDSYGRRLFEELREGFPAGAVVSFGTGAGVDCRLEQISTSVSGGEMVLVYPGGRLKLKSPMIGRYNLYNVAGVAALALQLGIGTACIRQAVAGFHGAPGRVQAVRATNGVAVFVDYAHTDDALLNVLSAMRDLNPRRLIAVFGCGGDRDRTKRPRMGHVAAEWADRVILTSDNPRTEAPEAILADIQQGVPPQTDCQIIVDRREAIRLAVREAAPGDIVLLAGKGHENYQEVNGVKHDFDDVCEVRAAMLELGLE
jgi:UDP-N-acetylmuramoyl-L-alanyl-D-glutamate--2,6-diaminopimelate ligase